MPGEVTSTNVAVMRHHMKTTNNAKTHHWHA